MTILFDRREPRRRALCLAPMAAALSLAAAASAATPPSEGATAELPRRRPGYWRISTISPEIGSQTHEVCIKAGDSIIGHPGRECSQPAVQTGPEEVIVTFSCDLGGARQTTSLLFTGDFSSWYRAQSKVTIAKDGGATQRTGFTIDAKFIASECPRPGQE